MGGGASHARAVRAEDERLARFAAIVAASNGRRFHEDYVLSDRLGRGAYGAVYSAQRADEVEGRNFAVKVVPYRAKCESEKPAERQRRMQREAAILHSLPPSDHIVQYTDFYVDGPVAYLVMEHCRTTLLALLLQILTVTEETMKSVFKDMALGIAACHAAGVVHRDVKPNNFLVSIEGPPAECWSMKGASPLAFKIKLGDFGLAGVVRKPAADELVGACGTPAYMAPEMLAEEKYGTKVDIWSLGATAYVLLYGRWPYAPQTTSCSSAAMKDAILDGGSSPSFKSCHDLHKVSPSCVAWVRALLARKPSERPSAQASLAHPAIIAPWGQTGAAEVSLRRSVLMAKRLGAFDAGDANESEAEELDSMLQTMNLKHHCVPIFTHASRAKLLVVTTCAGSDISTDIASDYRTSPCASPCASPT